LKNEATPLLGKTIAVTRPKHQSSEIVELIEAYGGEAILASTIEIIPKESKELDDFIEKILEEDFDYLFFLSVNSVTCLLDKAKNSGILPRFIESLNRLNIFCIGEKTQSALLEVGVGSNVSEIQTTEGLLQTLEMDLNDIRVGIPRSSLADNTLRSALEQRGAKVTEIIAYVTSVPTDTKPVVNLIEKLDNGEVDAVTFTSSSTARNLLSISQKMEFADKLRIGLSNSLIVSIGPKTRETLEEMGFHVDVVPIEYSIESMIEALVAEIKGEAIES